MGFAGGASPAEGDRMLDADALWSDHHLLDNEAEDLLPLLDV